MIPMSFQGSNQNTTSQGGSTLGSFNFAPKASTFPPIAWVALGAVALIVALRMLKR